MKIVEFGYKHMPYLIQWLDKNGKEEARFEDLPHIGYVAIHEVPVCIGFIHRAEGNFCFLGSLATNPDCSSEERSEAIDLVVTTLIDIAKILGFKTMIAWTVEDSILKRSEKFGFKMLNQTLIGKEL